MRTLVMLPNWVGDAILALPALEGLITHGGDEYVLAGRALPLELTAHLAPGAERVHLRKGAGEGYRRWTAGRALRRLRPARVLLLTPSFSSAWLAWLSGAHRRIGWPEQGRRWLLNRPVRRARRGAEHIVEEFKALAVQAGGAGFPRDPQLPRLPAAEEEAERLLEGAGLDAGGPGTATRQVALCPGVMYGTAKQWPIERFRALRQILEAKGCRGWVIGAATDRDAGERILSGAAEGWVNLAGRASLTVSGSLLRRCDAAVCNDTGVMHLAAAVGTPVVALFGPTEPRWTGPRGPVTRVLQHGCACVPCYARTCGEGHPPPCMAAITVEEVAAAIEQVLADGARLSPGLLLDRDGTLCELVPYLSDPGQTRLVPGAAGALRRAREAGYRIAVVSNQSGVARGLFGGGAVAAVHRALDEQLAREGAAVDGYFVCPHHPDYTGACGCRKPAPGMLREAASELGLDLRRSWMIGDADGDLRAGAVAGARSVLVRTGYGREQESAARRWAYRGLVADDLPDAIGRILALG